MTAMSINHGAHGTPPVQQQRGPKYRPTDEVDFVVVGAGSAGGVVARELAIAGMRVVVLEQGPWRTERDFRHDEVQIIQQSFLTNNWRDQPNTFRATEKEKAVPQPSVIYGKCVGGGSVHFTANYWRFHEIDFIEASKRGTLAGTGFADWPIKYADLEPYYTKVEWEVGVSGAPGPFDPPRSKGFPVPPLPAKSSGILLERGAKKLGWTAFPAPTAILSQPHRGRVGCVQCSFCEGFGCEVGAKSSTLVTMIPDAVRSGRCEIRPNSYVRKVEINPKGRVVGVKYYDADKKEIFQRAKAVVLCANGAETPRLLLMSKSVVFPDGLANSSGLVGKYLMYNGGGIAVGMFEHDINAWKGNVVTRIVHDTYELDPKLGLVGGGGFDFRMDATPIRFATQFNEMPNVPSWGVGFKKAIEHAMARTLFAFAHTTSLPLESNNVSLDPTTKDAWGLPALRVTYNEHPQDLKLYDHFIKKGKELLDAAGAQRSMALPPYPPFGFHLLGTCRMGNDPKTSVVDKYHRTHDVKNLFLVDGSSFVTGGRGQPTMTIQALAFRAAEYMAKAAKRGDV
jgi:choline dehydrogenase-like flavoprotein